MKLPRMPSDKLLARASEDQLRDLAKRVAQELSSRTPKETPKVPGNPMRYISGLAGISKLL